MKKPIVTHLFTADPSAHVFEGKIYIYPSHDLDHETIENDNGDHFDMEDYHVFSMDQAGGEVIDHGEVLHVRDVPWASKQMWAPDCAFKNGTYYFYFPARDHDNIFRIGVATSASAKGPFTAEPNYIKGIYSIDPCSFIDEDGKAYLYFGGLWGGQLERWQSGAFNPDGVGPALDAPAIGPRMARLSENMLELDEEIHELKILDQNENPLLAGDTERRFFEGIWIHKYNGLYYMSYSTGDTHLLQYATSESPYGPFTYQGQILSPVLGWTTHHSIVEFEGKWYLFYHDSSLSGGVTHKRSVKMQELKYEQDGKIVPMQP